MSTSDPSIEIPQKSPGAGYMIVLQNRDESSPASDSLCATGRHSIGFPQPAFADLCICCNQPARGRRHLYTPWVGTCYAHGGIELPLCPDCTGHAFDHPNPQGIALLPLIPGGIALGVGLWKGHDVLQLIGIGLVVATLLLFAVLRWRTSGRTRAKHHEGIDIDATPGRLRIATRNPELVRSVIALNGRLVHDVR